MVPGQEATTGPFRAVAQAYGDCRILIPARPDGTGPLSGWALVEFTGTVDAVAADADPDVRLFPDVGLDHVITAAQAASIADRLDHFGITGYPDPTGRTVRQVLRWVADRLDVTWRVE